MIIKKKGGSLEREKEIIKNQKTNKIEKFVVKLKH